jgi:hypothetical protein
MGIECTKRENSLPMRSYHLDLGAQGDEHRGHVTAISGMAFIRISNHMASIAPRLMAKRLHPSPKDGLIIEPTPISLAEISTQGAHGLMGRSSYPSCSLAKSRKFLLKGRRRGDIAEGGQRPNPQATLSL